MASSRRVPDLNTSLALHAAVLGEGGADVLAELLLGQADINERFFFQPLSIHIKFQAREAKTANTVVCGRFEYISC